MTVAAVIFDLDGVLLDSEQLWNQAKESLVQATGGHWREDAPRAMMGMSSPEWSAYLHDQLGVPGDADTINREVVARMEELYRSHLPLLPGAVEAVRRLRDVWQGEGQKGCAWHPFGFYETTLAILHDRTLPPLLFSKGSRCRAGMTGT